MVSISKEDKKYILNEHLRNISHISDKEYQKRVWIRGEGSQVDDFDETVCRFFGISDFILENYKNYGITESQYRLLHQFHNEFETFADENDFPIEFIDTPEWAKIMDLAKEVLKAFHYK